ncbi:helix-turn-helix domain-containing protein [Lentilactobacillus kosonis]|uniref:Transcriptional regulator, XRE family n=1 Tax=Lentilactobacillus kosonis TaxID=2810561 RepID=A0A401FIU3_9LACO|nr:helix-turn-helix transcriptional regulator [Lentilactobacillus kosonis]GAY72218.1 transcriptional regulator, XRE family [Lentilactobacillus kosonis]
MKLGQRLQEDRNQKSWTQERLAETLNISTQELSKWEASNGYPNIDQLIQISNLFELSLDTLIKDDSDLKSKIAIGKHQSKTTNAWGLCDPLAG